jgi:hypothetical protein
MNQEELPKSMASMKNVIKNLAPNKYGKILQIYLTTFH